MNLESHRPDDLPAANASNARLRVGLCITELEPGGAERCLTELALRIDRKQFQPFVYCLCPRPSPDKLELVTRLESAGVDQRFFTGPTAVNSPGLMVRLARTLRQDGIQVLQCFLLQANLLGALAGRIAGTRAILGGIRVAERRKGGRQLLARGASLLVDRWVCVSQAVADFASLEIGIAPSRMTVIENGVDLSRFDPLSIKQANALGLPRQRKFLIYVGRLDEQKGLEPFLSRVDKMLSVMPAYDLLLVGRGPLENRLKELASSMAAANRIHLLGHRQDIPSLLAASELFVFPSRWEGMPNAVLEAMAAGLPVVSTRIEGAQELLGEHSGEQTVAVDDYDGLVERVVDLAADPAKRVRLGSANLQRARATFSIDAMVKKYEQLFMSCQKYSHH